MQQITNEELGELKKLVDEMTVGPYEARRYGIYTVDENCARERQVCTAYSFYRREDMVGFAALRNHAASLIATVEAQREALEKALEHVLELEEAWLRGCLQDHDGMGGTRSSRNVEVRNAIQAALPTPTKEGT